MRPCIRRSPRRHAWLVLTLLLASCAHNPPARTPTDSIREIRAQYLQTRPMGPFHDHIMRGEVVLGMSFQEVLAAWGIPDARRYDAEQEHERWVYVITDESSLDWVCFEFLFEARKVIGWESSRGAASGYTLPEVRAAAPKPVTPNDSGNGSGAPIR